MALSYENSNGPVGMTRQQWPAQNQIPLSPKEDTLVMFAHPQCPCTRASMDELNRIMAQCAGKIVAHVFFLKPQNFPDNWVETSLWRTASAIPGVTVHEDPGGLIAQKFGAETSGFVLLYDSQGNLLFKGGVTASRGHAGDNTGEDAIIALATGKGSPVKTTRVYGCSLVNKYDTQPEVAK